MTDEMIRAEIDALRAEVCALRAEVGALKARLGVLDARQRPGHAADAHLVQLPPGAQREDGS